MNETCERPFHAGPNSSSVLLTVSNEPLPMSRKLSSVWGGGRYRSASSSISRNEGFFMIDRRCSTCSTLSARRVFRRAGGGDSGKTGTMLMRFPGALPLSCRPVDVEGRARRGGGDKPELPLIWMEEERVGDPGGDMFLPCAVAGRPAKTDGAPNILDMSEGVRVFECRPGSTELLPACFPPSSALSEGDAGRSGMSTETTSERGLDIDVDAEAKEFTRGRPMSASGPPFCTSASSLSISAGDMICWA